MRRWAGVQDVLVELADAQLSAGADVVTPCLAAFLGDHLRFFAFVRPFEPGAYHAPLIELLALAAALDTDRLAFSISGRAWSLDDPIVPVTHDADLRQRVLCLELVDGSAGRPRHTSVLLPFDLEPAGGAVGPTVPVWKPRHVLAGGQGWMASVLRLAVCASTRRRLRTSDAEIAAQARRVSLLGHRLHLEETVARRLSAAASGTCMRQDGPR